eukprot:Gregarina_sp_Poly_1__4705@NODE_2512_length_2044_cov_129_457764_g1596_i0_p1_GENE_NODE_2512_length_2044_cov_129_457764_g1596_i0NODE_2512_length_2044_cov_129_457764_g1596_i0_p1_ORF_typecomplete_len529_score71_31HYLS1_C/PF15311_6/3e03HYLS1_C/PF15311_6/0_25Pollen_allerg_1/PF01357_21/3_1e02Pollen_allerg_1/PF01357_21/3_9_NODE_2512_length_2044_cov_129_457764_g1596_i02561842
MDLRSSSSPTPGGLSAATSTTQQAALIGDESPSPTTPACSVYSYDSGFCWMSSESSPSTPAVDIHSPSAAFWNSPGTPEEAGCNGEMPATMIPTGLAAASDSATHLHGEEGGNDLKHFQHTLSGRDGNCNKWTSNAPPGQPLHSVTEHNMAVSPSLLKCETPSASPRMDDAHTKIPDLHIVEINTAQFTAMRRLRAGQLEASATTADLFHKVPLGEKGRMELKAAIRAAMKDRPELRERVNTIAKLRCATIPQLLKIAHICDLWDLALEISRRFVETRNGKQSRQAAIRKMAKSGACLITERRPLGPNAPLAVSPLCGRGQQSPPLRKSRILARIPPLGYPLPGSSSDYRFSPAQANSLSLCESSCASADASSPSTTTSQTSGSTPAAAEDAAAWAAAIQQGDITNYTSTSSEWQPLEHSYYDMYQMSTAGSASASSTHWIPSQQTANYYHQSPPATELNTNPPAPDPHYNARVDGACLYTTVDQTPAAAGSICESSPGVINPPAEHLAAISQFGLWAAEATPASGFV